MKMNCILSHTCYKADGFDTYAYVRFTYVKVRQISFYLYYDLLKFHLKFVVFYKQRQSLLFVFIQFMSDK